MSRREGRSDLARVVYRPAQPIRQETVYAALSGPLKPWQTRLIKLLPGRTLDASLQCEMLVADITHKEGFGIHGLDRYQSYDALSYSWGHPDLTGAIQCNGGIVSVPPAMETALRYLRLSDKPRWLWCDALCIDQANHREKSNQVQTMMDIFAKASKVVVWLGTTTDNHVGELFDWLRRNKVGSPEQRAHKQSRNTGLRSSRDPPKIPAHLVPCLLNLSRSQWFERIWCRQEVYAARSINLHVGEHACPLDTFLNTSLIHLSKKSPAYTKIRTMEYICISHVSIRRWEEGDRVTNQGRSREERRAEIFGIDRVLLPKKWNKTLKRWYFFMDNVLPVMRQNAFLEATDPKDRVYALFGMLHHLDPMAEQPLVVDYGQSISEVYQDLTKYLINRSRSLSCLQILRSRAHSSTMPGWTVDWTKDCADVWTIRRQPPLEEARGQLARFQDLNRKGELSAYGVTIGIIGERAQEIDAYMRHGKVRRSGRGSPGVQVVNAVQELLSTGAYRRCHVRYLCPKKSIDSPPKELLPLYGLHVPHEALPGDRLVYLLGSSMVYVIRPVSALNESGYLSNRPEDESHKTVYAKFIGSAVFWQIVAEDRAKLRETGSATDAMGDPEGERVWRELLWTSLVAHHHTYRNAEKYRTWQRYVDARPEDRSSWSPDEQRESQKLRADCKQVEHLTIGADKYHRNGNKYHFVNYALL